MLRDGLFLGFRQMARSPLFTLVAVLTLALGVGANTALLDVLDETLRRPLPLPAADRLVALFNVDRSTSRYLSASHPDYDDYARRATSFEQLAAYARLPLNMAVGDDTIRVPVEAVTANYFAMLRVAPVAGRSFVAEDDAPGAQPVVMLSERTWRSRFNADPALLGRAVTLAGQRYTVVGVVPSRYRGLNLSWSEPPEAWVTLRGSCAAVPQLGAVLDQRAARWLLMVGRLRPGTTVGSAQAEMSALAGALAQAEPDSNRHVGIEALPASRAKFWPGHRARVGAFMAALGGAAGLIVLLVCANLASLLLERGLGRRREFAIRLALGASRARLVAQLLLESTALVLPGFVLALGVAWGLRRLLVQFPNAFGIGLALEVPLGGASVVYASLVSLAALLLAALAPAVRFSRQEPQPALRASANMATPLRRDRVRQTLLVGQIAFSTVLLVGGGLVARSLLRGYATDPGFEPSRLVIATFSIGPAEMAGERGRLFSHSLVREAGRLPGVEAATLALDAPLTGMRATKPVALPGSAGAAVPTQYDIVGPGYLQVMGIPLLAGRDITPADGPGSARVAVVNRTLAERLWRRADVVGETIEVHERRGQRIAIEVIGVARDAKHGSVRDAAEPRLYLAAGQSEATLTHLLVRTRGEPAAVAGTIRRRWRQLAPGVPLLDAVTGTRQLDTSLAPERIAGALLLCFATLAVVLAAVGLYGMVAFAVAQRTREMGIRMAMGAPPARLVAGLVGRASVLVAVGLLVGAAASLALMRLAAPAMRGVLPFDAGVYTAVAILLALVALVAAIVPARRAARVDPLVALRCE